MVKIYLEDRRDPKLLYLGRYFMGYKASIKGIAALKKEARQKLHGKWGIAILVTFLAALITSSFSLTGQISQGIDAFSTNILSGNFSFDEATQSTGSTILVRIGGLIQLLIGGSMTFGLSNFFLKLFRDENPQVENLFSGFKYFGKNFLIQLIIGIFAVLWSLLIWTPVVIVSAFILFISSSSTGLNGDVYSNIPWAPVAVILILVFLICGILNYLIVLRYSMSFYVYIDNPNYTVMECISTSKEMMKGNKARLLLMHVSFIGWHILSILTILIGYLWLNPYINASNASFYQNLKLSREPEEKEEPTISLYKENSPLNEV